MKKYVTIILLFFNLVFVFSQNGKKPNSKQNSDTIYLLIDENDELVLIEDKKYVLLFASKEGLNIKKKKDSIRQGLRPFYDHDAKGFVVVNSQSNLPWLEFGLTQKIKAINPHELKKYNIKNREEFLKAHSKFSKKYAIKKQEKGDQYNLYTLYVNTIE
jgi:hypothetical protein